MRSVSQPQFIMIVYHELHLPKNWLYIQMLLLIYKIQKNGTRRRPYSTFLVYMSWPYFDFPKKDTRGWIMVWAGHNEPTKKKTSNPGYLWRVSLANSGWISFFRSQKEDIWSPLRYVMFKTWALRIVKNDSVDVYLSIWFETQPLLRHNLFI